MEFSRRLAEIYDGMQELLNRLKPEAAAVEKLIFPTIRLRASAWQKRSDSSGAVPGRRSTIRIYAHAGQAGSDGLRESAEASNAGNDAKAAPDSARYRSRTIRRTRWPWRSVTVRRPVPPSARGAPAARKVPGQVI